MKSDLSLPQHAASRHSVDLTKAASLLPLWLVALAITVEGFPRPPISMPAAMLALALAVGISLVALWQRWMTVELALVSFFPLLLLLRPFDEISTTYKTPFILLCALVLTVGILLYQSSRARRRWRWLLLLAAAGLAWLLAWHLTLAYWQMAAELGYTRCLPDAAGCAPLAGRGRPWWALLFAL